MVARTHKSCQPCLCTRTLRTPECQTIAEERHRLDQLDKGPSCASRPARPPEVSRPDPGSAEPDNSLCSRSEEHTSELQSRLHLVCRLLLEKKKNNIATRKTPMRSILNLFNPILPPSVVLTR